MMMNIGVQELVVIGLIGALLLVAGLVCTLPFWFICKKAGLSPWLSLLMLIPGGSLVLPYVLAFIDWPSLKKTDRGAATGM